MITKTTDSYPNMASTYLFVLQKTMSCHLINIHELSCRVIPISDFILIKRDLLLCASVVLAKIFDSSLLSIISHFELFLAVLNKPRRDFLHCYYPHSLSCDTLPAYWAKIQIHTGYFHTIKAV